MSKKIITAISIFAFVGLAACASKPNNADKSVVTNNSVNNNSEAASVDALNNNPAMQNGNVSGSNNAIDASSFSKIAVNNQSNSRLIDVGDKVFFETDSFTLTPKAREIISRQAAFLINNPNQRVILAGNCDERGTREYNLSLGARRANSVKDYLVSLGVNAKNIDTVSYGKERPIDDRPSVDGWAINRNVQTKSLN